MLRFIYIIFARICVMSTLFVCLAKFVGVLRHDPLQPMFTNPDGSPCEMPCILGIRPGETIFHDAMTLVQIHPITHNLRLFEGDFTGIPRGEFGSGAFHSPKWSVLFMGESGNAVALQIYEGWDHEQGWSTGPNLDQLDYHLPVQAVCLRSTFNNGTASLPQITTEMELMWHKTSFMQMVATLGSPQTISTPSIAPTNAWAGWNRLESFYFDERLVITHIHDRSTFPNFTRTFFDTVCVYDVVGFGARFGTGFHGRTGAVIPWLGVYAPANNYVEWMAQYPATEPVPVMP